MSNAKFIMADVPQDLIDLANIIDYSAVSPLDLNRKLQELEAAADKAAQQFPKFLKRRANIVGNGKKGVHKVRQSVPQELLDVLNKFDFSGYNSMGALLRLPVKAAFRAWVSKNLPTKRN